MILMLSRAAAVVVVFAAPVQGRRGARIRTIVLVEVCMQSDPVFAQF
jgi:hypothetical protein